MSIAMVMVAPGTPLSTSPAPDDVASATHTRPTTLLIITITSRVQTVSRAAEIRAQMQRAQNFRGQAIASPSAADRVLEAGGRCILAVWKPIPEVAPVTSTTLLCLCGPLPCPAGWLIGQALRPGRGRTG
jgi:hypothetical protein